MDHKKGSKAILNDWDQVSLAHQQRIKWTLRIAGAWLTFILAGAGIFVLSKPYIDRRRKERIESGEMIEYLYRGSPNNSERRWKQPISQLFPKILQSDVNPPDYLADIVDTIALEEKQNQ